MHYRPDIRTERATGEHGDYTAFYQTGLSGQINVCCK